MSGKTSGKSKDKYNKLAYERYTFRVRKDDYLNDQIKEFMSVRGTSLSYLVTKLLKNHFDKDDVHLMD
jgi:molybdate-binding protein